MNEHEATGDFSMISRPSRELTTALTGGNRILSVMVEETLALGRKEVIEHNACFKIGAYEWCEPDYRQILLWAEALKMEPLTVIEKLIRGEDSSKDSSKDVTTKFKNGRMLSLSWNLETLPLSDFQSVEGLIIEKLRIYGALMRSVSLRMPSLCFFECNWCELEVLILSDMPNLTGLRVFNNKLAEINLAQVPNLTTLLITSNQLTELNLAHVPNLTTLNCGRNQLTELNLVHVPNLALLYCMRSQLKELNLACVPKLTELCIDINQLKELNLAHVPNLTRLWCNNNQLTSLNLSHVPNLTWLRCNDNQLTELDIRPLQALRFLTDHERSTRLIKRPDQNF